MLHVTPTGLAKSGGLRKLLGSLEAVVAAVPKGGVLVIGTLDRAYTVREALTAAGREPDELKIAAASHGPDQFWQFPAETVIGVAPDAYRAVMSTMWTDVERTLHRRFRQVHWG